MFARHVTITWFINVYSMLETEFSDCFPTTSLVILNVETKNICKLFKTVKLKTQIFYYLSHPRQIHKKMVVPTTNQTQTKPEKSRSMKDQMELSIKSSDEILESNANVGMNGPLIDSEGFPRNDIDVHQVRQARQQIICLQNDYKNLIKEIETLLHQFHAEARDEQQQLSHKAAGMNMNDTSSEESTDESIHEEVPRYKPIVRVNHIVAGSPAEISGLANNDEIIEFSTVNSGNFVNLQTIGNVVAHMENQRIPIKVLRRNKKNQYCAYTKEMVRTRIIRL